MRKIIFAFLIIGLVALTGCQRSEAPKPGDMFGPSSTSYVLDLSAHPSVVQAIDPFRNPANSEVILKARLYKYNKGPLSRRTIYFSIYDVQTPFTPPSEGWSCDYMGGYGYLNGDQVKSVRATTDSNGVATVRYTPPSVSDLRVVCDTGEVDDQGNPVYAYYRLDYIEVMIKATWRGQEWPEDSLSETYGMAVIKVLR